MMFPDTFIPTVPHTHTHTHTHTLCVPLWCRLACVFLVQSRSLVGIKRERVQTPTLLTQALNHPNSYTHSTQHTLHPVLTTHTPHIRPSSQHLPH